MSAPKIVAAWRLATGWIHLLRADGMFTHMPNPHEADARLLASGQRAIWPEGHGVAAIEDIPKPEPLPTLYVWSDGWATTVARPHCGPGVRLVCTYSADENDVATVVRHEVKP